MMAVMGSRRVLVVIGLTVAVAVAAVLVATRGGDDAAARPDPFVRGPYVTGLTGDTARLRWIARDDAAVTATAVAPDGTVVAARDGAFRGLRPDTVYRWTAAAAGGGSATGTFTTAPDALTGTLTFVAFGDYGADTDGERAVAATALEQRPRFLITTGDNSYLAAVPDLLDPNIFRPLRELMANAPNVGVVGDHDIVFPDGRRALVEALEWPGGGDRFDWRYGPLQFIGLGLLGDPGDVPFLRRALARPGPAARFVVVHQPLKAGNPVLRALAGAPVAAVLSGHLHAYERRESPVAPGLPLLTVGTGGAPASDGNTPRSPDASVFILPFGLLRVDVSPGRMVVRYLDAGGVERDRLERRLPG